MRCGGDGVVVGRVVGCWGWGIDVFGPADVIRNDIVRFARHVFHHEPILLEICSETLDERVSTLRRPQQVTMVHVEHERDLPQEAAKAANGSPCSVDLLLYDRPSKLSVREGPCDAIN